MKVLDLFSGIGGFSLGLERAGMETVAFCENDKFCQKVLAKHWPNVPVHNNIEELDGREYKGTVDLVCGGFPCTPFSVSGKQRGKEDDRFLWPEMLRVIREVEPAWVIGENVSGIIHMELDNVLSDLEGAGYSCQSFVIPACGVDARHKRNRVWIVAHSSIKRLQRSEKTGDSLGSGTNREQLSAGLSGVPRRNKSSNQPRMGGMVDGLSRWLDEPEGTPRVIGKVPDRTHRLKALGNAVVPQVVEVLGRMVMEIENE